MSHPSLKQKYPMPWDTSAEVLRKLSGGSLSWGALFTPLNFCHTSLVIMTFLEKSVCGSYGKHYLYF